jgi:lipopolysaccharide transport system ATP-binding protein
LSTVIKIENLGKQYRLGQIGTGSLSHDLNRAWYRLRGIPDPYLKLGDVNDRSAKGGSDLVWALKDINIEIVNGEVIGIIGKNGAGKSTLLKLLSQITAPTVGEIKVKGRIAALLEVGTGFHQDLTGRENVFLNGAILGMTKAEIKNKFDEIIEFSGVEKYIDTPVKRYSSGMLVRLGFAVAAHLEPEILIVDEVLAVGDVEFQKKCLGKMKAVSGQGRTVLFVSHNMSAIQSLCSTAIVLSNGMNIFKGNVNEAVNIYNNVNTTGNVKLVWDEGYYKTDLVDIKQIKLDVEPGKKFDTDSDLEIKIQAVIKKANINILINLLLINSEGIIVFDVVSKPAEFENGIYLFNCTIPKHFLNVGNYSIDLLVAQNHTSVLYRINEVLSFEIEEGEREIEYFSTWPGIVRPRFNWRISKLDEM